MNLPEASHKIYQQTAPVEKIENRAADFKGVCLLVTDFDSPTGGIQKQSRRLLAELDKRGIRSLVCARNYLGLRRDEQQGSTVFHRTPTFGRGFAVFNSLFYLLDGLIWLVRRRNEYDVIHCQQMFGSAILGLFAKGVLRKPILVRITTTGETGEAKVVRQMPLASLRLRLLRHVDRWIALTSEMKTEIETLDVPPEKIRIIFNSTELPEKAAFNPQDKEFYRRRLDLDYEQIAVFTGRLSEEKGIDTLLAAWQTVAQNFPRAHLLLLGGGGAYRNVESEMRAIVAAAKIGDTVHFLGHVPNAPDYLLAANLFVLPTRTEGMSNSLVEAMAAGAAIVTTDIKANLDFCQDRENCLLVAPDDDVNLAASICAIFNSPDLESELGRRARQTAEEKLSININIEKYLDSYRALSRSKLVSSE